jgi:DUF4097 and DUF4098 domain-containing protein YvlB
MSVKRGEQTMEKTFSTPSTVRLFVENEVGLVLITSEATDTSTVLLQPDTPEAAELVERSVVECHPKGHKHLLVVKVPRLHGLRFIRRNGVTVRVTVPEGSEVNVVTASADVDVTGRIGDADFTTSSGDVSTDDVAGEIHAKTASGDVTMGNVGGELRVYSASGDLRCSRVEGRAVFNTVSGDVEIGAAAQQLDVKASSGNARLGELSQGARVVGVSGDVRVLALGEGTLHVRSVSGSVAVGVVPGVDLHVDVETVSGKVHSDIPLDESPRARGSDARVDITVRCVSGDVAIERALELVA